MQGVVAEGQSRPMLNMRNTFRILQPGLVLLHLSRPSLNMWRPYATARSALSKKPAWQCDCSHWEEDYAEVVDDFIVCDRLHTSGCPSLLIEANTSLLSQARQSVVYSAHSTLLAAQRALRSTCEGLIQTGFPGDDADTSSKDSLLRKVKAEDDVPSVSRRELIHVPASVNGHLYDTRHEYRCRSARLDSADGFRDINLYTRSFRAQDTTRTAIEGSLNCGDSWMCCRCMPWA